MEEKETERSGRYGGQTHLCLKRGFLSGASGGMSGVLMVHTREISLSVEVNVCTDLMFHLGSLKGEPSWEVREHLTWCGEGRRL